VYGLRPGGKFILLLAKFYLTQADVYVRLYAVIVVRSFTIQ